MSEEFDPYRHWLGVPSGERPPNHYALLGLGLFEDDADVISNAADRQMAYVRTVQSGPHGRLSQQLLNELAAARLCLLDRDKKARYDAELKAKQVPTAPPPLLPPPVALLVSPVPARPIEPRAAIGTAVPVERPIVTISSTPSGSPSLPGIRGTGGWLAPAVSGLVVGLLLAVIAIFLAGVNQSPGDKAKTPASSSGSGVRQDTAIKRSANSQAVSPIFKSIEPPSPLGVVAEELVIWNTHNGGHNDRGTLECNVRLMSGGGEVWSQVGMAISWAAGEDRNLTVTLPATRFDAVRIEITKWENLGGGLAEVEVFSPDGRNLALGCPTLASGVRTERHEADHVVDGITTSAETESGYWLLPDQTAGWVEVDLSWPRPAKLAGVTADKLVIWNQHNGIENNCGTKWCDVTLLSGARIAWQQEHVELPWAPWQDLFVELKLPRVPFDRVRVAVTPREGQAAGLAEVQVLDGADNLALGCPTIADAIFDKARSGIRVTDGIVSSESHTIGYWLRPGPAPGWVEIDLACVDAKYGEACRRLGLTRVIADGDWPRALPWLARGDDRSLRQLARADLQDTTDTAEQLGLGDAWWDFAHQADGKIRKRLLARSLWRYRQVLDKLHEFRKAQVEARINKALPALPESNFLFFMPEEELRLDAPGMFRGAPPVSVKGVRSPYGLFTHAVPGGSCHAAFRIGKRYRRFRGAAAINDTTAGGSETALTFRIVGDGRELWKSSPLKETGSSEAFDLDIAWVDKLELFVDCPGGNGWAHSVWLEPRCER